MLLARAALNSALQPPPSTSASPPPQDAIGAWLDGLLSGKVRTAALQGLPEFPAAGEGAEGGAAEEVAAVEEDEFSLEDIMKVCYAFPRCCCLSDCVLGLLPGWLCVPRPPRLHGRPPP